MITEPQLMFAIIASTALMLMFVLFIIYMMYKHGQLQRRFNVLRDASDTLCNDYEYLVKTQHPKDLERMFSLGKRFPEVPPHMCHTLKEPGT